MKTQYEEMRKMIKKIDGDIESRQHANPKTEDCWRSLIFDLTSDNL